MRDIICDVTSYCAASCAIGKILSIGYMNKSKLKICKTEEMYTKEILKWISVQEMIYEWNS